MTRNVDSANKLTEIIHQITEYRVQTLSYFVSVLHYTPQHNAHTLADATVAGSGGGRYTRWGGRYKYNTGGGSEYLNTPAIDTTRHYL